MYFYCSKLFAYLNVLCAVLHPELYFISPFNTNVVSIVYYYLNKAENIEFPSL